MPEEAERGVRGVRGGVSWLSRRARGLPGAAGMELCLEKRRRARSRAACASADSALACEWAIVPIVSSGQQAHA